MENNNLKPEKITKPIQLLAAWLTGLILLVSALLTASNTITKPEWLPAFLCISAVAIIPIFLILIFLLQTKFRPQMQEDEYYSKFLNRNTLESEPTSNEQIIEKLTNRIEEKIIELSTITINQIETLNENIVELTSKNGTTHKKEENKTKIKEFQEFINEVRNEINFNIKLSNANEILAHLAKMNIKIDKFFGDNEKQKKPELFLLSFGVNVDIGVLKTLIIELKNFGLTHLRIVEESFKQNSIYIGSYAFGESNGKKYKVLTITPQLIDEINKCSTTPEVYVRVLQHMK